MPQPQPYCFILILSLERRPNPVVPPKRTRLHVYPRTIPVSCPKSYITGLEDRLEALEALLHQVLTFSFSRVFCHSLPTHVAQLSPDNDFSAELGPPVVRGSWKSQDALSKSLKSQSILATNLLPPLLVPYQTQGPSNVATAPIISSSSRSTHLNFGSKPRTKPQSKKKEARVTFHQYRSDDSDDGESSSSSETDEVAVPSFAGREKVTLRGVESDDATEDNNMRFHGRSSTAGLVEVTRQFKHIHFQADSQPPAPLPTNLTDAHSRRRQFWKRPDVMFCSLVYLGLPDRMSFSGSTPTRDTIILNFSIRLCNDYRLQTSPILWSSCIFGIQTVYFRFFTGRHSKSNGKTNSTYGIYGSRTYALRYLQFPVVGPTMNAFYR